MSNAENITAERGKGRIKNKIIHVLIISYSPSLVGMQNFYAVAECLLYCQLNFR